MSRKKLNLEPYSNIRTEPCEESEISAIPLSSTPSEDELSDRTAKKRIEIKKETSGDSRGTGRRNRIPVQDGRKEFPVTDYSTYRLSAAEWLRYGAEGAVFAAGIAYVFYRSTVLFFVFLPLGILYPLYKKKDLKSKRNARLAEEFREGIMILSSSLSAGFSFENAMRESESELRLLYGDKSMIVSEFEYINHRMSMNITIEKAWEEFAARSASEDIRNFVQVIRAAKRSGGELNTIIAHTADTIGDKIRIEEDIKTMTSAKRLEQNIMNLVPVFIVIYIDVTSPGFFDPLYQGLTGRVIMTVCLCLYLTAILISKRILAIEI